MESEFSIDLTEFIDKKETALVGREHGESLLDTFAKEGVILQDAESKYSVIRILVPKSIMSINKSYFLGAFETRIQALGAERFSEKYHFETSEFIQRKITKNISAALLSASQGQILGLEED